MSDRSKAAVKRIRAQVPILQVLVAYGYRVRDDGGDREQQFSCDLHGSGRDNKPSARVYPDTNSWFCFGCAKTRDAVETVKAKEGVGFWAAVKILEKAYGLEPLPFDYEGDNLPGAQSIVQAALDPAKTFEDDARTVQAFLDQLTLSRDLPLPILLRLWEAYDQIGFQVRGPSGTGGTWTQVQGREALAKLQSRIHAAVTEERQR